MFTGLVEGTGSVEGVEQRGEDVRLEIATPLASELHRGDSVAVSGVCLTAVEAEGGRFVADVVAETLRRSSLGPLREGDEVNLELPLRAGDRLGGHVVQGHVDGLGTVASVEQEGSARVLRIAASASLLRYVVEKGSIAVDGVSLTAFAADETGFSVSLVPETLERTTLGALRSGSEVNLEVDVIAKYVEKLVAPPAGAHPST
jgi:riboflavin synthase